MFRASCRVPGSCGELVQGTIGGVNFHVTCPVNLYSRVEVWLDPGCPALSCPPDRPKTRAAVLRTLELLGRPGLGGEVRVFSLLPPGKGMASSTADLAAACYATAAALGVTLREEELVPLLLSLEPSDGVFLPGIWLFDHVRGRIRTYLGEPLPLGLLALDFGGSVDTLEFNRRPDLPQLNRANEQYTAEALALVREGLARGDARLVGEGATLSARANQKILPRPYLEELVSFARRVGAYGVNVAHSGTVAGLLLPPGEEARPELHRALKEAFPEVRALWPLRLVSGGPRFAGEEVAL